MHTIYVEPTKEEYEIIQNNTIQVESPMEQINYQNKKDCVYGFLGLP